MGVAILAAWIIREYYKKGKKSENFKETTFPDGKTEIEHKIEYESNPLTNFLTFLKSQ